MKETMKAILSILLENYQGLRYAELEKELKNRNILSPTQMSKYLIEGKDNGWITESKERYFITRQGAEWLNVNSLMEIKPIPSRKSKETFCETIGIITPSSTVNSFYNIQSTSTTTATNMIYPNAFQISKLEEIQKSLDEKFCSWLEKNDCKELIIVKRYAKDSPDRTCSKWTEIKQIKQKE